MLAETTRLKGLATHDDRLSVFGLFGRLQQRTGNDKLPRVAAWLLESGLADLDQWRSLTTRKRLSAQLSELASRGMIMPIVALLQDNAANTQDATGAQMAAQRLSDIAAQLAALQGGAEARREHARHTGNDIATGMSLLSLLGGAVAVLLGG